MKRRPPCPGTSAALGCLSLLLFVHAPLPSQTVASADSARAPADSVRAADTTGAAASSSGIDSVVTYAAVDSIVYSLPARTMYLYGQGDIAYRELGLKAENIDINWNTSILNAQGIVDTADTTGKTFRGQPELKDGGETYHGATISYDFKTKKGKIDLGKTEIENGFYRGEEIKKVAPDVLFVQDGRFTTCDLPHPHYYFGSPEMKVIVKDKVIARPVYLYIADVPVFALPFGIFPSERGRRSGVIAPAYGESIHGRYLQHLGYYWAMNDYMDWSARGDGYTDGSWVLNSDFRYALRYFLSGGISASYKKTLSGERGDPRFSSSSDFRLGLLHNQQIDPTTRLVVNFTFASGPFYRSVTTNFNDLLRQNIVSDATLTKSWEGTPNSLTVNIHRDQNITPNDSSGAPPGTQLLQETLPSVSFSRNQTYPFRSSSYTGSGNASWYDLVGYSYSGQFLSTRLNTATAGGTNIDRHGGINHRIVVNASPKVGYFSISPFFNYTENWYSKSIFRYVDPANDSLITQEQRAIKAVRFYSLGVSASTKLYGIVQPGIFGITGIRHQMTPTISYTYAPDFSKPGYGYFGRYTDSTGVHTYSYYDREPFDKPPGFESQAISFRLQNIFEMKTAATDTSGQERKFQLLNLDLSSSYNFAADSLNFAPISMVFRTSIGQFLNIDGASTFNLYKFELDPRNPQIGRRVNKFLLKETGRLADMTNFRISLGTRLSGEKQKTTAGPIRSEADSLEEAQRGGYIGLYDQPAPDFSIPWNLDLSWSFNQNRSNPLAPSRTSVMQINLGFNLTEFWKITAATSYDLLNRQFAAPQITVYRDLHCWEMNFSWVPTGFNRNYRLEIRLKAPQLQDVKLTKQQSALGWD